MKFWDASAVIPLLVDEPTRQPLIDLLVRDPSMVVWWGTPVECTSAIARREREGSLDAAAASAMLQRLRAVAEAWHEVLATDAVRDVAQRLLRVHPLRAADALQLAAALACADGEPNSLAFVCLDSRLAEAAQREGLQILAR
jgi:predicted nucleic acid-binding protein